MTTIKIGDKVIMNNKYNVPEKYKGVIFTVASEPWDLCGTQVFKLHGYAGGYASDGLTKVEEK